MTKYNLGDAVRAIRNAVALKSPIVEIKKTRITERLANSFSRRVY
jgi:ribosomal protein S8